MALSWTGLIWVSRGVYVLTEKIKRDKNRVDMAKLTPEDITLTDMSGGYLLSFDKTSGMDPVEYWESPYQNRLLVGPGNAGFLVPEPVVLPLG